MKTLFIQLLICVLFVFCLPGLCLHSRNSHDAVLLDDVQVLTLQEGAMTTARRSSPIPQLTCIGGRECQYKPHVVQCRNMGKDHNGEIQWKCEAELAAEVKFGELTVECEGYDYPDDPYILKGSCGLRYQLEFTDNGRQRQSQSGYQKESYQNYQNYQGSGWTMGSIFTLIIIAFVAYIIYSACFGSRSSSIPPAGGFYGRNDGPPPYNYPPPPPSSGPGFWSGLFAGGLASTLFRPSYYGNPGRSWFGGWGGGNTYVGGPSGSYGSGPTMTATSMPSRTSAGYARTARR